MQHADILVYSGCLFTMDEARSVFPDGAVAIRGSEVVAVGETRELRDAFSAPETIDARGQLIMPGLIDCHLHPMLNIRSAPEYLKATTGTYQDRPDKPDAGSPFDESAPVNPLSRSAHRPGGQNLDVFFDASRHMDAIPPVTTFSISRHSLMCAVRGGATTFIDGGAGHVDGIAEAALAVGIRAGIGHTALDQLVDPKAPDRGQQRIRDTEQVLQTCEEAARRWEGRGDGLLRSWLLPTVDTACSDELLRGLAQLSARDDLPVMTHAATTASHDAYSLHHFGKSCIRRMHDAGLMDNHWLGIHMGFFSDEDLELLLACPAHIAHCASTSANYGKGIMVNGQLMRALRRGVPVGIGTDTLGNSYMLRELQIVSAAHREAQGDSRAMPPYKTLELATRDAARVCDLTGQVGELKPGLKADLITVDIDRPEYDGFDPLYGLLLFGQGEDVRNSIIDGRIVMRDRSFPGLDEDEVRRDMRAANAVLTMMMG